MDYLPMDRLGPRDQGSKIHFGLLLPGIDLSTEVALEVRLIHEKDQFIQDQPAFRQRMVHGIDPDHGDYWETEVDLAKAGSGRRWGAEGRYVYRFALIRPDGSEIDWIIDPFAREFGVGRHAAFTYGYQQHQWDASEAGWRTPRHQELILYEVNLLEFAGSLEQAVEKLDYLQDLGVTCVSLMPVTNVSDAIDWGYTPIGYFGVDERFGKRSDFQKFVEAAHRRGIAVVVDAIYGHTSSLFAYEYLYRQLGNLPNPIMGSFAKDMFGPSVDWSKSFAQDFFYTVNRHWLEVYHVDGFRYDCVPNYWELWPHFRGFASIAYYTHRWAKTQAAAAHRHYVRFEDGVRPLRLIQCAEQLEAVSDVLKKTYSTCAWQNETIAAAESVARGETASLTRLGLALGAHGLPTEVTVNGDRLFKSPLQYIENHDHDRFICHFGVLNPDSVTANPLFEQGDRSQWFKVQPYLIGMLMAKGIPLLWQGQELGENSKIAPGGTSRTGFLRIVHWEYFYDHPGRTLLSLVRKLLKVRASLPQVRDGEHYFFNDLERYQAQGLLLFARYYPDSAQYTLVALNFSGTSKRAPFWFPVAGAYREELHGRDNGGLNLDVRANEETWLEVPPHYGRIWTRA